LLSDWGRCRRWLMGSVSRSGGGSSDELVTLVTVHDPIEAEIILGKLHSAGIAAYANHDALSVVWGLTVDGAGRNDIVVRVEDLPEAQAALKREL
jgi:hypothetical protein